MERKRKILIADDEVDIVELLKRRLRSDGYDTAEAYDGEQCLKLTDEFMRDLILLDVLMPRLNGFEVCRRLKADKKKRYIPVLILTAKADVESKVTGLDIGAYDYLPKPFAYDELSARVRSLIEKKEASERLVEEERSGALEQMFISWPMR